MPTYSNGVTMLFLKFALLDYKMAAVVGSDSSRSCGIGCFSETGVHSHRQRAEDVLLRNTEGMKSGAS
jgi:hypothetical protein